MIEFFLKRFAEPSTWMGLMAVAASFGLGFTPEQTAAIATFGALLCAVPDKQHS